MHLVDTSIPTPSVEKVHGFGVKGIKASFIRFGIKLHQSHSIVHLPEPNINIPFGFHVEVMVGDKGRRIILNDITIGDDEIGTVTLFSVDWHIFFNCIGDDEVLQSQQRQHGFRWYCFFLNYKLSNQASQDQ
jgi:hypothetical protein